MTKPPRAVSFFSPLVWYHGSVCLPLVFLCYHAVQHDMNGYVLGYLLSLVQGNALSSVILSTCATMLFLRLFSRAVWLQQTKTVSRPVPRHPKIRYLVFRVKWMYDAEKP